MKRCGAVEENGTYILSISKGNMADTVAEVLSLDRKWRKILEDNPDLRGTDYSQGEELEKDYQRSLGYNV